MHFAEFRCARSKSGVPEANLFSPDTYFGTDFRLSVNATGLLCNSILPVVTLCIVVLYSIFYL